MVILDSEELARKYLLFVIGMIVLGIVAPIFLVPGIRYGSSANASLFSSFEIVATTVIALLLFREAITKRLWAAVCLISPSVLLFLEGADSFEFSVFVLTTMVCWGLENNCTPITITSKQMK